MNVNPSITAKQLAIAAGVIGAGIGAIQLGNAMISKATDTGKKILPQVPMIYTAYQSGKTREAVENLSASSSKTNEILQDLVESIKKNTEDVKPDSGIVAMPYTKVAPVPFKEGWA